VQGGDFPGLYLVLGEEDATRSDLMETGKANLLSPFSHSTFSNEATEGS